ncbi:uncharacterized protein EI90DRAFT_3050486, partial [Cantharellus anzutake]|uniref:uncharacterized protein n=1 Tax=Cantharellus anzutake TaxID=1750568 RepID=UPI001904A72A
QHHEDVIVADPAFQQEDIDGLTALGFVVTSVIGNGHYDLTPRVLLYMPHCDLSLHEDIFKHNWESSRLHGLFMIANDLTIYSESMPTHKLRAKAPFTAQLLPHLCIQRLPKCASFPEAFNDLAIQWIPNNGSLPFPFSVSPLSPTESRDEEDALVSAITGNLAMISISIPECPNGQIESEKSQG